MSLIEQFNYIPNEENRHIIESMGYIGNCKLLFELLTLYHEDEDNLN